MIPVVFTCVYQKEDHYFLLLENKEEQSTLSLQIGSLELGVLTAVLPGPGQRNMMADFLQITGGRIKETFLHRREKGTLVAAVRILYGHTLKEFVLLPCIALLLTHYTKGTIYVAEDVLDVREDVKVESQNSVSLEMLRIAANSTLAGQSEPQNKRGLIDSLLFLEPQNLDFHDGTSHWFVTGTHRSDYEVGVVSSFIPHKRSLFIRSRVPEPGGVAR
ncbi:DUF151 domain-containing protein [Dictyobacter kobayashii]|uniref:BFN domain-containing protein n=1 Tax=Dictyobacter kobayashii TaxID=2014872 RepID=A0A402ASZ2_9CHLR|nr:DUF151 domain-containing protein [Dictyobacter kobayashii]GCE22199.1 hypothetical protein KDK_59990 [Dictyobacter kobayashii]